MLDSILEKIERIYDLELEVDINDFLISKETCARFGEDPRASFVLVQQSEATSELQLGVHLREETLNRLRQLEWAAALQRENFDLLCTAIEEVSHFAYLFFNASQEREVTQLELELQAEVDKFVTSTLITASQNGGRVPANLLDRVFKDFELREDLDGPKRDRYLAASSLASRYCSHLVRRFREQARFSELLLELRSFYRLSQGGKIGRIHHAIYATG